MKICLLGVELLHAGRRTDRHDEANSLFRNFANAREKGASIIKTSMIQPLPVMKYLGS